MTATPIYWWPIGEKPPIPCCDRCFHAAARFCVCEETAAEASADA